MCLNIQNVRNDPLRYYKLPSSASMLFSKLDRKLNSRLYRFLPYFVFKKNKPKIKTRKKPLCHGAEGTGQGTRKKSRPNTVPACP